MRWGAAAVALAPLLVAAGCAGAPADPSSGDTDPDQEYAVMTTILQEGDGEPELCLGGVAESYPPQCGGLAVIGLDWDDVADAETASGTTWGTAWVVGTYDAEAGTFTLTRAPSADPPEGVEVPAPEDHEFPPLCDDPYRGGDESFDPSSDEGFAAQTALQETAAGLDGYISLYVSDGSSEFNVLVVDDAEAAHQTLREVWPGWLCVAVGEGAPEADRLAAQEALHAALGPDVVLGSGAGNADGVLNVQVVVADDATTQAVHDAVEPWLTPDQVVVTGALIPLP